MSFFCGVIDMNRAYRAVEVASPGQLRLVQRTTSEPGPGQVRIQVEACGVCHSDSATVDGTLPGISYPRVPGHEAVGRIDSLGERVQGWAVGQRVAAGFLAASCRSRGCGRPSSFVHRSDAAHTRMTPIA